MKQLKAITHWLMYTVLVSFFPLIAIWIANYYMGYKTDDSRYIGEILFVCIFISANSLYTLSSDKYKNKPTLKSVFFLVAITLILMSSLLYGYVLINTDINNANKYFMPIFLMSSSFLCGFAVQIGAE